MKLLPKDIRHLMYMERWATYKETTGALSLEEVISRDGGKYFPSILSHEDTLVHSFDMENIPEADVLLVWNSYPRVLAYAAEIAVRYRNKYGYYPGFMAVGDGRGMFRQRRLMSEWFERNMVRIGFSEEWVLRYHTVPPAKNNMGNVAEISWLVKGIPCAERPKVLAVSGSGYTLRAATELVPAMPFADICFFETPQLELSARLFDSEVFSVNTYAADMLLAHVVLAQMRGEGERLSLPVEKLLDRPCPEFVRNLLFKGFAGCFCSPEMWRFVGINPKLGMHMHERRIAYLQQVVRPKNFDRQAEQLLKRISRKFADQGLVIVP